MRVKMKKGTMNAMGAALLGFVAESFAEHLGIPRGDCLWLGTMTVAGTYLLAADPAGR